jgi:hypothetical protein
MIYSYLKELIANPPQAIREKPQSNESLCDRTPSAKDELAAAGAIKPKLAKFRSAS